MVSAEGQKPVCPVCHRADQVKNLQAAYDSGIQRFAPPPLPVKRVSMMRNMTIGMFVVGICIFFIIILVGSESFGQDFSVPELLLVLVTLVGIITALVLSFLAFQHLVRSDMESQQYFPAWDRAIENWNRLRYCSRDKVVFDPGTNKTVSDTALTTLVSIEETQMASAAH